ncbi:MAG: PmoA family protein [Bryobacterales bacterium]|nr:PmoA family protein [Bryobacterales bacterium]
MWFSLLLAAGLGWTDLGDGRLELRDGGNPVLVYNSAPLLPAGVPEDRRRCCYIYPVYTPGRVAMLDDFPKDHYHHRGVFWGWPVVEFDGKTADIWMMKGIGHRLVRVRRMRGAGLEVENGWFAQEKQVVREVVKITGLGQGSFRVELELTALNGPVTLRGAQDKGKSYGGFSARFGVRDGTVIRTSEGAIEKDEDLVRHSWAELSALYGGKPATLRITAETPYQWCLRKYGFVGASVPGREGELQGMTLEKGKPVVLRFTVSARDQK